MYSFLQVKPFKPVAFPALKAQDKTVGELSDAEAMQAHEDWIRAQLGHMGDYHRPHLSLLLSRLDDLRDALEEAESFVDRHSEPWYRSGQELLAKIRAALGR